MPFLRNCNNVTVVTVFFDTLFYMSIVYKKYRLKHALIRIKIYRYNRYILKINI